MPHSVRVIRPPDFIRARADGVMDLEAAEKLMTFARKTAVLCPMEKFDRARFFALCAENKGFNVEAFTSYEEAMDWLLGSEA